MLRALAQGGGGALDEYACSSSSSNGIRIAGVGVCLSSMLPASLPWVLGLPPSLTSLPVAMGATSTYHCCCHAHALPAFLSSACAPHS
jgi:hypothetical protein